MTTVTLTMHNGHNPVSGISFRKVTQDGSDVSNGGSHSNGDVTGNHRSNGVNGSEHSPSDKINDSASVDAIRLRLKKGRNAANRNGRVIDPLSGVSSFNNNGPLKAFPLNNNVKSKLQHDYEENPNNSSLPDSASELPSSTSSGSNSTPVTKKISNPRQPLQRIHGHGHQRQHLPPGLADPMVEQKWNGNAAKVDVSIVTSNPNIRISSPRTDSNTTSLNASSSPLKSALHKNASKDNQYKTAQKEVVTFAEFRLPPGMQELRRECFAPSAKGCFEHQTELPLLISTDAAILKRRSSISQAKKNRFNVTMPSAGQITKPKTNQHGTKEESVTMVRSRSSASDIFVQPDMEILRVCWSLILSFMGDDKNLLTKHNGYRTIGAIVSTKKKYFSNHRRLFRKSSADSFLPKSSPLHSPTGTAKDDKTRPNSMFVFPSSEPSTPKKVIRKPHSSTTTRTLPSSVSNLTVLEKVHFLINVGLKLPYLRDEIYSLVMKQLVNNPSTYSTALGWILLALITGSFPPSEKIMIFVENFIHHHQHAWSKYCSERLKRTVQNGPRCNTPCSLEIKAAKSAERILCPVICMDNSALTLTVDPATTSKEMIESMAAKSRIKDPFGYCIVLQSENKVVNLGAGRFPVMDALSQVEAYGGRKFSKTCCRLYYRRDIFSPRDLFCSSDDSVALRLTFYQICGGVKSGEYFCRKAPDLSLLVAHQYCVRYGKENADERRVVKFCEKCLPVDVYKADKKSWGRMVANTIRALAKKQEGAYNPIDIMSQVVRYAVQNLATHFIRTYNITTFVKVGGICTYTSDLSLSMSHDGVAVRQGDALKVTDYSSVNESEVVTVPVVLMEIPAGNLKKVKLETKSSNSGGTLTITDYAGGSYEITSAHGPEIYSVLFRYIRDITTGANKESRA